MSLRPHQRKSADKKPSGQKLQLEKLESRLLFSADLPFVLPGVAAAYAANDDTQSAVVDASAKPIADSISAQQPPVELVIIDTATPDYKKILSDIQSREHSASGYLYQVHVLDSGRDGVSQITEILQGSKSVSALHIVSHGADGQLALGSGTLDLFGLLSNAEKIAGWSDSFTGNADILVYGCELAASAEGEEFVTTLSQLTSTDVAASEDLTGNAALGGDWVLEYRTGQIETGLAVSGQLQEDFGGVLMDLTVTTTDDTLDSGISAGNTAHTTTWLFSNQGADGKISLREAIIAANNTADPGAITITLGSGTYTLTLNGPAENFAEAGDLNIHRDIIFNGAGVGQTIVDGNLDNRIFEVKLGNIEISNMTLTRGFAGVAGHGGALQIEGSSSAVLDNVSIEASSALNGGGIYSTGTLSLVAVNLSNNAATGIGGGLYNGGDLTIDSSVISGNYSTGDGGGIHTLGSGNVSILNSTVSSNLSDADGGALRIAAGATVNAVNAQLADNQAINGGAVYNAGALSLLNSTVDDNSAVSGGGVYNTGDMTLTNITVSRNSSSGAGGGVYSSGVGTVNLCNSTLAENLASAEGGGLAAQSATLQFVTVGRNTGTSAGGIAVINSGSVDLGNTLLAGNNSGGGGELSGAFNSLGYNLVSNPGSATGFVDSDILNVSALFTSDLLSNHGGVTETLALRGDSRGIAEGNSAGAPATDQRGVARDASADIGAYEFVNVAPQITSSSIFNANENRVLPINLNATDANEDSLQYTLIGSTDDALFNLGLTSGQLSFITPPDFETPDDAGGDNTYNVTLQVADPHLGVVTQNIAINVNDVASNIVVTTLSDIVDGDTSSNEHLNTDNGGDAAVSLREAIIAANNSTEPVTISFNIAAPLVGGVHPIVLGAVGLPDITNQVTIDGTTDSDYVDSPVIVIDGSATGLGFGGINLASGSDGSTVKGLAIVNAGSSGITAINSGNHTFVANYIGTDGAAAQGNTGAGIVLSNSSGNTIGGSTDALRNVISGNSQAGITISGSSSTGNRVEGNYIGTNAAGSAAIANGTHGISINTAANGNVIGGIGALGNVISGNNLSGVMLTGNNVDSNAVFGNLIGTNQDGTSILGNGADGVSINGGAANNSIGGAIEGQGNVISGNLKGIEISGTGTDANRIYGNRIGTNAAGTQQLGNTGDGIRIIAGAVDTQIGGSGTFEGNVISGNGGDGIEINDPGSDNTLIQRNHIGTVADGTSALGNGRHGVVLYSGVGSTVVGGTTATGNVIAGNASFAVVIDGSGNATENNSISGNRIGTDRLGTSAVANGGGGVHIRTGASNNTVGGATTAERNIIAGNVGDGVLISGAGTEFNTISGNFIGTDVSGTVALGNSDGIKIWQGAANNTIGGNSAGTRNVISGNTHDGIEIMDVGSNATRVYGNYIGVASNGSDALGNVGHGVIVFSGAQQTQIGGGGAGLRNVISGNGEFGVAVDGDDQKLTIDTRIQGNYIGTDYMGVNAVGNAAGGIYLNCGASDTTVGGDRSTGRGNLVSGHATGTGILVEHATTTDTHIMGNSIGTNADGDASLANLVGIYVKGSPNTTIGSVAANYENLISGNTQHGVLVSTHTSAGSSIIGNLVGVDISGAAALGNGVDGVRIESGASQVVVGGDNANERNVVSGNGEYGVRVFASTQIAIQGNFVGTDSTGTAKVGNTLGGILLGSATNTTAIGGSSVGSGNLISGNNGNGVVISSSATNLQITGNTIGLAFGGAVVLGNLGNGVVLQTASNTVGGTTSGQRNVISGNSGHGILLATGSDDSTVVGNYIGVFAGGTGNAGNGGSGVEIESSGNRVGGTVANEANIIAYNSSEGIAAAASGTDNAFLGNAIFGNTNLSIDLGKDGSTPNEAGDLDTGANDLQNFPQLTAAQTNAADTIVIQGQLESLANTSYRLEFFASSAPTPASAERYLGFVNVMTDGSGLATFDTQISVLVSNGESISATATQYSAGVPGNTSELSAMLAVSINDRPTTTGVPNLTADEDAPDTNFDLTPHFTDIQDPDPALGWQIVSMTNPALFSASSVSGSGILNLQHAPDQHGFSDITVSATDTGGLSVETTFRYTVSPVNDLPVVTSPSTASLLENTLVVGTVSSTDVDGAAPGYAVITGDDGALFQINQTTGLLSFITAPDFENPVSQDAGNAYRVTIEVDDGGGVPVTQVIDITVQDENDNTPVIAPLQSFDIAENALNGATLGVPVASDADVSDTLQNGQIVSGNSDGIFALHPVNGMLSVVDSANLDHETTTQYTLGLTVSDGVNTSAVQTVTINVLNVNEHMAEPITDSDAAADSVSENLAPGATVGITAFSQDRDSGDAITYSLSNSSNGNFVIDSVTGVITTAAVLDYRDATSRILTAVATSDDGSTETQSFTVQINSVNIAPAFTSAPVITAIEDSPYSYSIVASDADGDALAITATGLPAWLTLTDNGDGTAVLSGTPGNPDVGSVIVSLSATDGLATTPQVFSVAVDNVNDAPVITSGNSFSVLENGVAVGTVTSSDVDGGAAQYRLIGSTDDGLFNVDINTGAITFNVAADFENPQDVGTDNTYTITAEVTDGQGGRVTEVITVSVINDNEFPISAIVDADTSTNTVSENAGIGTSAGISASASDGDGPDDVSYTLDNSAGGLFSIDSQSGAVTLNGALDFESASQHTIVVNAASSDGSSTTNAFVIDVGDVNEAPGFLSAAVTAVNEQSLYRYEISVSDPERQALAVTAPTLPAWLTLIDNADGTAVLSGTPDDAQIGTHTVALGVSDGTLSATQVFTITVSAINDPPLTSASTLFTVNENELSVGTVQATDVDSSALQYSLAGGSDEALFSIDAASGALSFSAGVDFENPADFGADNEYNVVVKIVDGDGGLVTTDIAVTVNNVNEFTVSAIADLDGAAEQVLENNNAGALAGITANALDADKGASVSYSLDHDAGGLFSIDAQTGIVRTAAVLDFETATSHSITVKATSTDGSQVTADFTITVLDTNDVAPIIPPVSTSVSESAQEGATVITLGADDQDTVGDITGWSITGGDPDGIFSIDSQSGQISVANASLLDFETTAEFYLEITVSDGFNQSLPGRVLISILDVNEAPVIVSTEFQSFSGYLGSLGTLTIVDPETGDLSDLIITGGSAMGAFQVEPQTRELLQTEKLAAGTYTLDLLVTDSAGASSEATLQVRIVQSDGESGFDKPPEIVEGATTEEEPETGEAMHAEETDVAFTDRLENSANEESTETSPAEGLTADNRQVSAGQFDGIVATGPPATKTLEQSDLTVTNNNTGNTTNRGYEQILDVLFAENSRFLTDFNVNVESLDFSLSLTPTILSALDNLHSEVDNQAKVSSEQLDLAVKAGAVVSISLSVGFVTWLLQTGALAATALSTSPLWRSLDPIPVLGGNNFEERRRETFGSQKND